MFISDSLSITRIAVVSILAFILVVIVLRISGKRTLSKMNSFDFIVTVALGSVLASILTSTDLPLIDGILAFSLLVFMQYITSWLSVRSNFISDLVKSQPRLLYYQGKFDNKAMKKERITQSEILQAVRNQGKASFCCRLGN
ncbi:DUF421 domain-containing protein [Lacticigenium naphthae]|uniref:DUF421 domain-containing protein n=1 Tax=Lacticigenium naphthae TaxID=515351 RepID=UPI001B7FDBE6|nr:DUF421 domain-containing protein [Lacticigenium naphthae]